MTFRELTEALRAAGIEPKEAAHDAQLLLGHFCSVSPAALLCARDREYDDPALARAAARRAAREPLQYILGRWPFLREEYEVSPACLIPRPETELLAEAAIAALPDGGRLLDLCCGSGCVGISVLAARPDCSGAALDLFPDTLSLAARNARINGVEDRLVFRQGDVTDPAAPRAAGVFDVITSNPPYIRRDELPGLAPELAYEPAAALDGGPDGLCFYRALLTLWLPCLAPRGVLLLEIGADQGKALCALAAAAGLTCEVRRDLAGLDRLAVLTRNS